jgi:hypothetical protein
MYLARAAPVTCESHMRLTSRAVVTPVIDINFSFHTFQTLNTSRTRIFLVYCDSRLKSVFKITCHWTIGLSFVGRVDLRTVSERLVVLYNIVCIFQLVVYFKETDYKRFILSCVLFRSTNLVWKSIKNQNSIARVDSFSNILFSK